MEGEVQATESATPVSTETQVTESPPQESIQDNSQQEQSTERPTGFDPVDVNTATPDQIKARMDRLYGNMKRYETVARKVPELEQTNQVLAEQLRILNEKQNQVINHLHTTDFQDAEQNLKSQRQQAWQAGNSQLYDEINDKLRDLSVKRAVTDMNRQQPQQQQIPVQQPVLKPVNGEDVINRAVQQGAVTQDEATIYRTWSNESDDYGNPRRPWLSDSDPKNIAAASEGRAVFNNPAYANMTFGQKLQEIDRRMGMKMQNQGGQNVLPGGNLTPQRKNNNVKVTDYEAKIAIKTKFGGSKAKSESDHIEAWRQAKIKSQTKGASR